MDNELRNSENLSNVQQLYGEGHPAPPSDADAEQLLAEQKALSEAKHLLDHRSKERPDVEVIDRVVAAAAEAKRFPRKDRGPVPLRPARIVPMRFAIAACTLFVAVGIGYVVLEQDRSPADRPALSMEAGAGDEALSEIAAEQGAAVSKSSDAVLADEPRAEMPFALDRRKDADDMLAAPAIAPPARAEFGAAAAASEQAEARLVARRRLTEWNEPDNMVVLRRRIDRLSEANAALEWDDAAVPLEMLPVDSATLGPIGPAGRQLIGAPKSNN